MIRSMTGYGDASCHENGSHFFLEVRSLNSKYFKATIRLPDEFQGLEAELESELRRRLSRGTVTLVAKCSMASESAAYTVNAGALRSYVDQVRPLVSSTGQGGVVLDVAAMLALPGVLQAPADEEQRLDRVRAVFMALLDKAIGQLLAMRRREGEMLATDLMAHHAIIAERLSRIHLRAPTMVQEYEKRLRARIEMLLADASVRVETVDLIREVAVYADRSDISEEIARLDGHLNQFQSLLKTEGDNGVGRTLDFLAQEMLREANTIASKSGDASISRDIVEIKGAIDRIKEQVQNVE